MNAMATSSFLPEDYVERRKEQRTNLICLTLFGVVLVGVVGAWAVTTRQRSELRDQRAAVNRAYTDAAKRLEQLEKLQQQKLAMLRKAEITRTLVEPVPRTFLLADLINRMPATLSLTECKVSTKNIAVPVPTDPKKSALANAAAEKKNAPPAPPPMRQLVNVTLVGLAPTDVQVAQYMSALSQSQLIADVNLTFSEESKIADTSMRSFRIEITLKEKADVRTIEPLLIQRKLKQNPMQPEQVVLEPGPGNPVVGVARPIGKQSTDPGASLSTVETTTGGPNGGK